ncbi:hypothetical protein JZM24_14375 [Candidatus Sodalis endolongispinus]|uniref:Uncharacterized protein n=1 Tax=Candidatus Sodalis endolongispinus TaxID=2812662 RepID=A0ABS5YEQ3_9GAMM|nr:hypothetical protein [Candidatus Sodalis endolongispinus]MBT9433020.1 hypothetical protein [Candidatus Sodalis endolongispinus]
MAISPNLARRMIAGDQSVYHFNLWLKTVVSIKYILTGRSLQEDYEVLFNLLNIKRPRILDKMPATDIKALRHLLGFIRMIDNSPPALKSQFSLLGRFRQGRIAVRLSYDDMVIREVSLTEEAFGLLNNVFTVNERGTMIYVERTGNGRAAGRPLTRGNNPSVALARQRAFCRRVKRYARGCQPAAILTFAATPRYCRHASAWRQ